MSTNETVLRSFRQRTEEENTIRRIDEEFELLLTNYLNGPRTMQDREELEMRVTALDSFRAYAEWQKLFAEVELGLEMLSVFTCYMTSLCHVPHLWLNKWPGHEGWRRRFGRPVTWNLEERAPFASVVTHSVVPTSKEVAVVEHPLPEMTPSDTSETEIPVMDAASETDISLVDIFVEEDPVGLNAPDENDVAVMETAEPDIPVTYVSNLEGTLHHRLEKADPPDSRDIVSTGNGTNATEFEI
jgi:hypothetical protein